jgi:hypothetical protein
VRPAECRKIPSCATLERATESRAIPQNAASGQGLSGQGVSQPQAAACLPVPVLARSTPSHSTPVGPAACLPVPRHLGQGLSHANAAKYVPVPSRSGQRVPARPVEQPQRPAPEQAPAADAACAASNLGVFYITFPCRHSSRFTAAAQLRRGVRPLKQQ